MNEKVCVFCEIAKGEIPAEKIDESNNFFAIRDSNPWVEGHSLVIPKKHFVTLLDIPDKLGIEFLQLAKKVSGNLIDNKLGNGFNLLMNNLKVSGQVVMHAHVHIIPRKEGDGIEIISKENN